MKWTYEDVERMGWQKANELFHFLFDKEQEVQAEKQRTLIRRLITLKRIKEGK